MRHFFLSLAAASAALLCGIGTAHAVPAKPGLIQVTQSDGTQLTVRLVGDERRHYMLSSDGYTLTGGPDGDLYYAELSASGKLIPTKVKARPVNALTADEKAVVSRLGKELKPTYVKPMVMPAPQQTQAPVLPAAGKPAPPRRITSAQTTGRLKSLIILVESSDKKFASASAQQDFRNLLMQDGYSVNGATGSAWNYYQDNSNRLFDPEFVVVGPYKASKTSAYYAGSEGSDNVPELIVEACRLADNDVNFTDFADNGVIRDVFVFYAGRGQADSGDTQSIWPHRWDVRVNSKYLDVRFDGVQLQGYACGAELNGGAVMGARTYRVNRIVLINLMYLTIGLLFAASGMLPPTAFALFAALSLIEGVTSSVFNSSFVSVIQSRIDAGVLGRVMSLYYSFGLLPSAIGLLGTGFLAEHVGLTTTFVIAGTVICGIGLIAFCIPSVMRLDRQSS